MLGPGSCQKTKAALEACTGPFPVYGRIRQCLRGDMVELIRIKGGAAVPPQHEYSCQESVCFFPLSPSQTYHPRVSVSSSWGPPVPSGVGVSSQNEGPLTGPVTESVPQGACLDTSWCPVSVHGYQPSRLRTLPQRSCSCTNSACSKSCDHPTGLLMPG